MNRRSRITLIATAAALVLASAGTVLYFRFTGPEIGPDGKERIAPPGAPYSYSLPTGWVHGVKAGGMEGGGRPPGYLTSVGPPLDTEHTNAIVSVEVLNPATMDQTRELAELSKQGTTAFAAQAGDGWTMDIINTAAGEARQVTYQTDVGAGTRYYFFHSPSPNPVFVQCQWLRSGSAAESMRGCAEVVQSLQITG